MEEAERTLKRFMYAALLSPRTTGHGEKAHQVVSGLFAAYRENPWHMGADGPGACLRLNLNAAATSPISSPA
jgi:hypothetical protein